MTTNKPHLTTSGQLAATRPDGGDSLRQSILETATDEEITQARRAKQERDNEAYANVSAALASTEGKGG